jgi:uncharacterized protein
MSVIVEFDAPARMRDGVTLLADIYRPAGDGPWPTLLSRTPYGKGIPSGNAWNGIGLVEAARAGFMVVVQDVRGRSVSAGAWDPFRSEGEDGADSIAWAAALPGSNGRVGMFGGSYCGSTQWVAAKEQPPALAAITPLMTWSEPMDGLVSRGGAVELALTAWWALLTRFDSLFRAGLSDEELAAKAQELIDDFDRLPEEGYWGLPVSRLPVIERHGAQPFVPLDDIHDVAASEHIRVEGAHDRVQVPSLNTAGWFDVFTQGTLDNFTAMRALGRETRLIVGPWTHADFYDPIGERRFGTASSREWPAHPNGEWAGETLAFLGRHLADGADPDDGPAVRLFVMGANVWRDEDSWPLERTVVERWHLHADGGLSPDPPRDADSTSGVVYDPANPVPTHGGSHLLESCPRGSADQARIESRDDVLVFTSEPLSADLEVTGRVRIFLNVESSAPSTDWVARLCDVLPDGRSFNLCDGIVRVGEGADGCRTVEIDLWSTSNVFLAGHRIRVQVTNSCFPRWDRNLNTGDQDSAEMRIAHQRVHHGVDRPSFVELPVVPY